MKRFISKVINEFSKEIFKNQSSFRENMIDLFHSFSLKNNIQIIRGNIKIDGISFEENKSKFRSNTEYSEHQISRSYTEKSTPDYMLQIINDNKKAIQDYLGANYQLEETLLFRNYNIPAYLKTHDIYSNIWHLDSHNGFKLLKIFVLLHDTGDDDGPFYFLERKDTVKYWNKLRDRWTFQKMKKLEKFDEEKKFTGKKGDYVIINTSICMHRASIPKEYRDMAQTVIYPKWIKNE